MALVGGHFKLPSLQNLVNAAILLQFSNYHRDGWSTQFRMDLICCLCLVCIKSFKCHRISRYRYQWFATRMTGFQILYQSIELTDQCFEMNTGKYAIHCFMPTLSVICLLIFLRKDVEGDVVGGELQNHWKDNLSPASYNSKHKNPCWFISSWDGKWVHEKRVPNRRKLFRPRINIIGWVIEAV